MLKPKHDETEYQRYMREKRAKEAKEKRLRVRAEKNKFRGTIYDY